MKKYLVRYPIHGYQLMIVEAESKKDAMRKVANLEDVDNWEPLDHEITKHSKPTEATIWE